MKHIFKFNLLEFSGSLGDIGVFMPLAIGLIRFNNINPTSLFLAAGLLYIISGFYFRMPMPVQPLKATSVIAITIGASQGQVSTTAVIMGILFVLISYLKLDSLFLKAFPRPIVRGIQLSLGILLAKKGVELFRDQIFYSGDSTIALLNKNIPIGLMLGIFAISIILISKNNRGIPSALILVFIGLVISLFTFTQVETTTVSNHFIPGYIKPQLTHFRLENLYTAFFILLLPQIPLTFANSVAAAKETARIYFPDKSKKVTARALLTSLGIANLFSGIIGGMPMCHGSGGITAHYRFGARTGRANLFIGCMFIIIALLFGRLAVEIFSFFPTSILGVMLIYIGIEHIRLVGDIVSIPEELFIAVSISGVSLISGNLAIGFGCGIVLNQLVKRIKVGHLAVKKP